MRLSHPLPIATLATLSFQPSFASPLQSPQHAEHSKRATSPNPLSMGDSSRQPQATIGYIINNFSLVTSNLTAALHFYKDILGMREIFTYTIPTSDSDDAAVYQIAFLEYPHGGKNGTGYQTAEEMLREQTNTEGLLEILYLEDAPSAPVAATQTPSTFVHLGMVVPDVVATEARMRQYDVPILKAVGEMPDVESEAGKEIATAFGLGSKVDQNNAQITAVLKGITGIGFERFLSVKDPDGNLVNIQEQS